ncbi:hypothetical protein DFH09DRAFT_1173568 [Mycena vulgaris]|nr:hypothetical protein DFH09DRAFT_1173568 [Mycena vulgaris]
MRSSPSSVRLCCPFPACHSPGSPMWILPLLSTIVSSSSWLVCAAQTNYTIDDTSPLVEYDAALWARNPMGFNISQLNNGTVTFVHPNPNATPTIAMNFTGTAVYIFVAYPTGKPVVAPVGFIALIDDFHSGEWTADQKSPLTNFMAFSNNSMVNKPHTLRMQLVPGASLYFDYAIVTSDADPNLPSASSPTPPSPQDTSKKHPVAAIAGGVVGGVLLIALIATPLFLRRRAMKRKRPVPSGIVPFVFEPKDDNRDSQHSEKNDNRDNQHAENEVYPPPPTPFTLQPQRHARSTLSSEKSALSVRIPSARPYTGTDQTLESAASPVLTQMAEEMRRITISMQRLESGLPEARDGGSQLQRPPAYGDRRE